MLLGLSASELWDISAKSTEVVANLSELYTWVTTYGEGDKIVSVHIADNHAVIRRYVELGGFPVNWITQVAAVIGPAIEKK